MIKNELASNLKHIRAVLQISQYDLADLLHTTRARIGGWEEGRNEPSIENLIKLKNLFGYSLDTLICSKLWNQMDGDYYEYLTVELMQKINKLLKR